VSGACASAVPLSSTSPMKTLHAFEVGRSLSRRWRRRPCRLMASMIRLNTHPMIDGTQKSLVMAATVGKTVAIPSHDLPV